MNRLFSLAVFSFFQVSLIAAEDYEIKKAEFVFDQLPHESCHASTIVETPKGLVICWFGGLREGHPSVGIWISRNSGSGWSKPQEIANGIQKGNDAAGKRFPCWNPVLFQMPKGDLFLFYKEGPSPREWWGRVMKSGNGGTSWSPSKRLPNGILGPIKNKPMLLADGRLLCGSSTEHDGWKVHMEWTTDPWDMNSWQKSASLKNQASKGAIQPALLKMKNGYKIVCRNQQRESIVTSSSTDGKTWSPLVATNLPNPNSGIDSVTLKNGLSLVVYNPTTSGRSPISIAWSKEGKRWERMLDLDDEPKQEFSYPAVIQTSDGKVHVTYTWKRKKIKHVVLVPKK